MISNLYNQYREKNAYLELIIGPMYAGKTSKLIDIYKQYQFCNIPVVVINHSLDTRYDNTMLSTHDKIMIPCIKTNKLLDIYDFKNTTTNNSKNTDNYSIKIKINEADVILINEGQFFEDLCDCVEHMLKLGKKIYIAGLDGDFERKPFGKIIDLIPLCDKITKLTSLCSMCKNGTLGIFSKRLTDEKEQTIIGSDNYIPVCRNCYEK
jgi:thymidine kinase